MCARSWTWPSGRSRSRTSRCARRHRRSAASSTSRLATATVSLVELGPAHTGGDTIVHVPDASLVFTGDLLFNDGTPIVWADYDNWIAACDRILEFEARTLVPGHGPVGDASGLRDLRRYLVYVRDEARKRFDAGMDEPQAADDIDLSDFADWGETERIVANVIAAYRAFDPSRPRKTRESSSRVWGIGTGGIESGHERHDHHDKKEDRYR